jgi:hypothetical protein
MIILLLSGWAGAGKDATAYLLASYGFKRFAFADPLKKQVAAEFGFPVEWCHTQRGKLEKIQSAGSKTVRELLVKRGQEIRAAQNNPGYFAEITAEAILESGCDKVVISDWRLPCEWEAIHNCSHKKVIVSGKPFTIAVIKK